MNKIKPKITFLSFSLIKIVVNQDQTKQMQLEKAYSSDLDATIG